MRNLILLLLVLLVTSAKAQWTNLGWSIYYASGNVGIGTSSPTTSTLHINSTNSSGLRIQNITGGAGNKAGIDFSTSTGTGRMARIETVDQGSFNGDLAFLTDGDNTDNTNTTEKMRITKTGNVGIGTTTPAYKLDVSGSINASSILINGAPFAGGGSQWTTVGSNISFATGNVAIGTASPGYKLDIHTTGSLEGMNLESNAGGGSRFLRLFTPSMGNGTYNNISKQNDTGFAFGGSSIGNTDFGFVIAPWVNATTGLRVNGNGNVSIGTAGSDAMLTVNGDVHAKEVKVDLSIPGPDYVFEKDYSLPSLESIKAYVDQNKHLPEVPSAKEMAANGINLSEMNMLLLKKVEELTLYVIELKQQNGELKSQLKEVDEIKNEINRIKQLINGK